MSNMGAGLTAEQVPDLVADIALLVPFVLLVILINLAVYLLFAIDLHLGV
jgi:hypothetical protein